MRKKYLLLALFTGITFASVAQNTCRKAKMAFENGKYEEAISYYNICKADFGTDVSTDIEKAKQCRDFLLIADDAFAGNDYVKAAEKYKALLKINPSDRHANDRNNFCIAEIDRSKRGNKTTPVNTTETGTFRGGTRTTGITEPPLKRFYFGIKAGLNLSNIFNSTNDMDFLPKLKPDFHAGIFLNMRFGGWGLQPELLYSRAGFENNGNAIIFNYITVPVMAKLYFGDFNLELGPYVSYLATVSPGSTVITTEKSDFYSKAAYIKLSDLEKGADFGVAVGIEYDFDFGLTIGVRYNQGLSDMAKNLQWKNSVAAISLGYKF
jgi:tetratricopeptide (TPR) repeat protein